MNPIPEQAPRRILHLLDSIQRSGLEMMLLNSYGEWSRQGYKCDVLATANEIGPLAGQMRAAGYGVYHIPFRSSLRLLPRAGFVRDFYRLCRSGYDVVHIHHDAGPPIPALLAKLAGVRRIAVTPHNVFRFEGWLRVRKRCERHFVRMLGGRFGMISKGVEESEWKRFRNSGVRISNWIDTSHFRPPSTQEREKARRSFGLELQDFVVVSVANCAVFKNHGAVIRAISLLPAELRCLYLHIGREDAAQSERKLVAELGIENKVRFMGSQDDPLPFLWAGDVFVMPSLYEGLGMAAVEAIAAGTPAVLTRVDGLSDIAAATSWTVFLTSPMPESVAEGLKQCAAMSHEQRGERALSDSESVRRLFSAYNGIASISRGLYSARRADVAERETGPEIS